MEPILIANYKLIEKKVMDNISHYSTHREKNSLTFCEDAKNLAKQIIIIIIYKSFRIPHAWSIFT